MKKHLNNFKFSSKKFLMLALFVFAFFGISAAFNCSSVSAYCVVLTGDSDSGVDLFEAANITDSTGEADITKAGVIRNNSTATFTISLKDGYVSESGAGGVFSLTAENILGSAVDSGNSILSSSNNEFKLTTNIISCDSVIKIKGIKRKELKINNFLINVGNDKYDLSTLYFEGLNVPGSKNYNPNLKTTFTAGAPISFKFCYAPPSEMTSEKISRFSVSATRPDNKGSYQSVQSLITHDGTTWAYVFLYPTSELITSETQNMGLVEDIDLININVDLTDSTNNSTFKNYTLYTLDLSDTSLNNLDFFYEGEKIESNSRAFNNVDSIELVAKAKEDSGYKLSCYYVDTYHQYQMIPPFCFYMNSSKGSVISFPFADENGKICYRIFLYNLKENELDLKVSADGSCSNLVTQEKVSAIFCNNSPEDNIELTCGNDLYMGKNSCKSYDLTAGSTIVFSINYYQGFMINKIFLKDRVVQSMGQNLNIGPFNSDTIISVYPPDTPKVNISLEDSSLDSSSIKVYTGADASTNILGCDFPSGNNLSFKVDCSGKYSRSAPKAKIGSTVYEPKNGVITVPVSGETSVVLTGIEPNSYPLVATDEKTKNQIAHLNFYDSPSSTKSINFSDLKVTYGKELVFYVKAQENYQLLPKNECAIAFNNGDPGITASVTETSEKDKYKISITYNGATDAQEITLTEFKIAEGITQNVYLGYGAMEGNTLNSVMNKGADFAQMTSVYYYIGAKAPDNPLNSSELNPGVFKANVDDDGYTKFLAGYNSSVTIYVVPTEAYNLSDYKVYLGDAEISAVFTGSNYRKYNFTQSGPDSNVVVTNLEKNQYDIKFSGTDLSDRITLWDGSTQITDWGNIKLTHGLSKTYTLKPKPGYTLDGVTVTGCSSSSHHSQHDSIAVTFSNISSVVTASVTDVPYKKYKVTFVDENNRAIGESTATIKSNGNVLNDGYNEMTSGAPLPFKVELGAGYSKSQLSVTASSGTVTDNGENSYSLSLNTNSPSDVKITISGLKINNYDVKFESASPYVFVKCPLDSATSQEVGTSGCLYSSAVKHGENLSFEISIAENAEYNFKNDTSQILESLQGVDSKTIVLESNGKKATITLTNVTEDLTDKNSVKIKALNSLKISVSFKLPEEIKKDISNKVEIYQMTDLTDTDTSAEKMIYGYKGGTLVNGGELYKKTPYFKVKLLEGVAVSDDGLKCTDCGEVSADGKSIVFKISDDILFDEKINNFETILENLSLQQYNISFNEFNGATVKNDLTGEEISPSAIQKGSYGYDFKFIITPDAGYSVNDIEDQIEISNEDSVTPIDFSSEKAEGNSYIITIEKQYIKSNLTVNITMDLQKIPLTFNAIDGAKYYNVDVGTGETAGEKTYSLSNEIRGVVTVPYETGYCFAVKPDVGYDLSSLSLKKNGFIEENPIKSTEGYYVYEISEVKSNINITGSISKRLYEVKFDKRSVSLNSGETGIIKYYQDGTEIAGNLSVPYGESASFKVSLSENCNQSAFKIMANGNEINPVNGTYTLLNVTSEQTVSIENVTLNKYTLNFVAHDAAVYKDLGENVFSGTRQADHNSTYSFKVEAKTGYVINDSMKVIAKSASGIKSELTPNSNGEYCVKNIKEDYTVSIESVDNIVYNINLTATDGVTYLNDLGSVISGSLTVKYANNFEFSVNVDDAYDDSIGGMYIIVNDGKSSNLSAQKLASGRYIIPNITEDVNIKVGNIRKNRYTVTLTKTEGMDYYSSNGKIITGDNEVDHKGSISFKVGLYPAYADSSVTVMLGDHKITSDDKGFYTVSGVQENKTVTVLGVEETQESQLVNLINNLPASVESWSDVDAVVNATRIYNSLSDDKKERITNIDVLEKLQQQVPRFHHTSNNVTISGADWNIKLVAVPISNDTDACSRIYKKLNSEYILSLYDVYLWDSVNDRRYTLPEGKTAVVTLPTPDMTYFENPTAIHENTNGKVDYISLSINGASTQFEASSFSPMGIIANRTSTPGRSSLLDAADANANLIKDYALSVLSGGDSSSNGSNGSSTTVYNDGSDGNSDASDGGNSDGNISETFKSRNNKVSAQGSALRLTLVLMLIILIAVLIWIIFKNRKDKDKS